MAALRIIAKLEDAQRFATEEEQAALLKFSGWGGLLQYLRDDEASGELLDLIGSKGLLNARDSALTAFYTPNAVAAGMWDLLKQKGYTGGRVSESSAGTGVFLNQRLAEFDHQQHFTAIELERISARVLKHTNPGANVINSPYERVKLPAGASDLIIGNVPFGELRINDGEESLAIHNYFLRKGIEQLRVGGVVAILTSTWTLDAGNSAFRQSVADQADLLCAIRLPGGVFSAGHTAASGDLLVFRKRAEGTPYAGLPFVEMAELELRAGRAIDVLTSAGRITADINENLSAPINQVFMPGNGGVMAGNASVFQNRYGDALEVRVEGNQESVIRAMKWAGETGGNWFDGKNLYLERGPLPDVRAAYDATSVIRPTVGSMSIDDSGDLVVISSCYYDDEDSIFHYTVTPLILPATRVEMAKALVRLKQTAKRLLEVESATRTGEDEEADALRAQLNDQYDTFVAKHGIINGKLSKLVLRNDAEGAIVFGLELHDEEREVTTKSSIFSGRVIKRAEEITSTDNIREAVAISYSRSGRIVGEDVAALMGAESFEAVLEANPEVVYRDPVTKQWLLREVYLSGNVREKIEAAKAALIDDPSMAANIRALEMVMPVDVPLEDIHLSLASTWIPNSDIEAFVTETLAANGMPDVTIAVGYTPSTGRTFSKPDLSGHNREIADGVLCDVLGTQHRTFFDLLDSVSSNTVVRVTVKDGETTVYLPEESQRAQAKAEEINTLFCSWLISSPERADRIHRDYNRRFNSLHFEEFQACNYPFPGLSPMWKPRAHQESAVLQGLMTGNMLVAHCVGAGKTMEMVMLQMERKRLGIYNKPAIAVPNHMLYQMATEAASFYPGAKIAMITKADLEKGRRQALMAKIAMNDWDLVVLTHGSLAKLQVSPQFQLEFEMDELDKLSSELDNLSSMSARQKQLKIRRKRDRIAKLSEKLSTNSDPLTWEMLGIDGLAVDEAHSFKNLELDSVRSVPGISDSASDRAWDLFIKSRQLFSMHGGEKGLDLYTGTPLLNSISELYTMHRFAKPSIYASMGIHNFSDWVGVFGQVTTELEMLPEGGGYHMKARMSRFANLPELLTAFRLFANVKTPEDLNLPVPAHEEHVVVAPQSRWLKLFSKHLTRRAKAVRSRKVDSCDDNLLKIVSDGRKSAMDMRLIDPRLPKEDGIKVDHAVQYMLAEYHKHADRKGAQIIFCDVSTPSGTSEFNPYDECKRALIAAGVPEAEIAFIQHFKKDEEKAALFTRVRNGDVRFLFGSTETLGAGTNVQDLLCAAHDLDAPWRPGDLVQRKGRSVRQGNQFDSINLYRYTTEDSFDLFMWETNKRKALTIDQIMRDPKSASRTLSEDSDIDFAQVVAVTTGDPAVREKVEVDGMVAKLERKEKSFYAAKSRVESNLRAAKIGVSRGESRVAELREEAQLVKNFIQKGGIGDQPFAITVYPRIAGIQEGPTSWIRQSEGAKALHAAVTAEALTKRRENRGQEVLANLLGLDILCSSRFDRVCTVGQLETEIPVNEAPHHFLKAVYTWVTDGLPTSIKTTMREIESNRRYLETQAVSDGPFPEKAELEELRIRQRSLDEHLMKTALSQATEDGEDEDPYLTALAQYVGVAEFNEMDRDTDFLELTERPKLAASQSTS